MKKLGKLTISPEKIMKNEELINLQGGYVSCSCVYHFYTGEIIDAGPGLCGGVSDCWTCGYELSWYYGDRMVVCLPW